MSIDNRIKAEFLNEWMTAALQALPVDDMIRIHNDCMEHNNKTDDMIEELSTWLDEELKNLDPVEAFRLGVMSSHFNYNDTYIRYNGYGNIETTDNPLLAGWIDVVNIADDFINKELNDDSMLLIEQAAEKIPSC